MSLFLALEGLMAIRQVHVEQEELVRQALEAHRWSCCDPGGRLAAGRRLRR
jgi:hypothetical protein